MKYPFYKYFFLIIHILGMAVFIVLLIIIWRKGKDPHSTLEGTLILARLSEFLFFLWIIILIISIFFNDLLGVFWTFTLLSSDSFNITGMILIIIGFVFEILKIKELGINFRIELPKGETEPYRIYKNNSMNILIERNNSLCNNS